MLLRWDHLATAAPPSLPRNKVIILFLISSLFSCYKKLSRFFIMMLAASFLKVWIQTGHNLHRLLFCVFFTIFFPHISPSTESKHHQQNSSTPDHQLDIIYCSAFLITGLILLISDVLVANETALGAGSLKWTTRACLLGAMFWFFFLSLSPSLTFFLLCL